jgi:hypothetical protein
VDEGAGLEQLERRRGLDDRLVVLAAGTAVAPVAERRPQPLAAGDEVGQRVGERAELLADGVELRQLTGQEPVEGLLHALAQVGDVERTRGRGRRHASAAYAPTVSREGVPGGRD